MPCPHSIAIIWIVLDSVGIGELPDAAEYGDVGRNTLGHIARSRAAAPPESRAAWSREYRAARIISRRPPCPQGCFGKGATHSPGQGHDDRSLGNGGHLAAAGVSGLPARFPARTDRAVRARHRPQDASATSPPPAPRSSRNWAKSTCAPAIPIVYTSGDSVFQIAAHEDVIPDRRALPHVRDRAQNAGRAESRGPRDRPAVYRARREISAAPSAATITPSSRRAPCCSTCWPSATCRSLASARFTTFTTAAAWSDYVTTKNNADGMAKLHAALARSNRRPDLRESGRFRHALRPPQGRRRFRALAGGI